MVPYIFLDFFFMLFMFYWIVTYGIRVWVKYKLSASTKKKVQADIHFLCELSMGTHLISGANSKVVFKTDVLIDSISAASALEGLTVKHMWGKGGTPLSTFRLRIQCNRARMNEKHRFHHLKWDSTNAIPLQ